MHALVSKIITVLALSLILFGSGYALRTRQEADALRAAVEAGKAEGEARVAAVLTEINAANARVAALQADLETTRAERRHIITRTVTEVRNAPPTFNIADSPALRAALSGLRDPAPSQD